MKGVCEPCLRRAHLVGRLAPRIAGLMDRHDRKTRALLALGDHDLVAALGGGSVEEVLEGFERAEALAAMSRAEVSGICRHDQRYPGALNALVDAPAALFVRGDAARLGELASAPSVAIVGSRRPSPYGLEVAAGLGRSLAAAGVGVVSGLALGIDAAAHRGCIEGRGFPVAVLAGGPDIPYPRSHRRLYADVVAKGLVLSEMPPGQRAFRWSFPARNRLMAGIAGMTVVVEAFERSGSLITADFAQDLGRPVGAVPGRVTSRVAAGCNGLIRDGGALVRDAVDILDELLGTGEAAERLEDRTEQLSAELRRVLDAVEAGEGVGAIASAAGLSAREARVALARLEAEGFVSRGALGSYERNAG